MTADLVYLVAGGTLLLAVVLPQLLRHWAVSAPMVLVAVGMLIGLTPLPDGMPLDPQDNRATIEHVTELTVLVALMGVGLALDRPLQLTRRDSWRGWSPTWRLLVVAMPLCIGAVALRNSNHFGTAMYYTLMAARQGCIGFLSTNASPAMAPWGGRQKAVGTNPWSWAAPAGSHPPMVLDIANTGVARGKVYLAKQRGLPIPEGWAIDASGRPTTDPVAASVPACFARSIVSRRPGWLRTSMPSRPRPAAANAASAMTT